MYTTVRHSEGIDKVRLLSALRKLPGFSGCYVFDDSEALPNLRNRARVGDRQKEPLRRFS
jgi:hypothetical protein